MTGNLVESWGEIIWVIASIAILVAFALALALAQSGGENRPAGATATRAMRPAKKRLAPTAISIALPMKSKRPGAAFRQSSSWRFRWFCCGGLGISR
jgi:hypothetical protein